jgi:hypothetical protein
MSKPNVVLRETESYEPTPLIPTKGWLEITMKTESQSFLILLNLNIDNTKTGLNALTLASTTGMVAALVLSSCETIFTISSSAKILSLGIRRPQLNGVL